ncbi:L-rhamnose isomerase [Poriferisphaera sp. WC338]|uniref:L-rhamnose isomerase n=1 Tax=Poriferisphaera sp. WC338 TaxID=3425129 RepID=UPI003D81B4CC
MSFNPDLVEHAYEIAKEQFHQYGVDTEIAMQVVAQIPISLHCWQGDDVAGFEHSDTALGGGLAVTGNYPGKATDADQLRQDLNQAYALIPGKHRLNLHAIYLETNGKKVDRNNITPTHFSRWIDWAKQNNIGLDFNPSCFSHPLANSGFTLSHQDVHTRQFWIEHCIASRTVAAEMGKQTGSPCVNNIWIPDGFKDTPIDRKTPRDRLTQSLDSIFKIKHDPNHLLDSVESKLFGIGSESCVIGSHEFYLGYAISRKKLYCLDAGHFHPTEVISDKISSVMNYLDQILLHVSRGVRWDSDHVVTLNDELTAIAQEIVRSNYTNRIHIGLDFFDASINRIAAWVIGTRNMIKALLIAHLEPIQQMRQAEINGDFTARLALLEESKTLPFGAVWNYYCQKNNVPTESEWLTEVRNYESEVLSLRG